MDKSLDKNNKEKNSIDQNNDKNKPKINESAKTSSSNTVLEDSKKQTANDTSKASKNQDKTVMNDSKFNPANKGDPKLQNVKGNVNQVNNVKNRRQLVDSILSRIFQMSDVRTHVALLKVCKRFQGLLNTYPKNSLKIFKGFAKKHKFNDKELRDFVNKVNINK